MITEVVDVLRGVFSGDASGFVKAGKLAEKTAGATDSKVTHSMASIGRSMTSTGATMTAVGAGITGVVTGIGLTLGTMAANFESEMGKTRTLLAGITDDEFRKYEDGVLRIARATGKGAAELGGSSLYEVISSEVEGMNEQLAVLELSTKSAVAGIGDTNAAIALGKALVESYGEDWSTIFDKAQTTINLGKTNMGELGTAIGRIAPLASELGVSMDELFGAYATLTGVTGNTNEVTTALRGSMAVLLRMHGNIGKEVDKLAKARKKALKEGDKPAAEALEKEIARLSVLREQFTPAALKANGLGESLTNLAKAADYNSSKMLEMGVTQESIATILFVAGKGADTLKEKTAAMTKSNGAMLAAYEERAKTFAHQWKMLVQEVSTLGIELGRELLPVFRDIIGSVKEWFEANRELVKQRFREVVEKLTERVKEAWPVIEKLAGAFGSLIDFLLKHPLAADVVAITAALGLLMLAIGPVLMGLGSLLTLLGGGAAGGGIVALLTTLAPAVAAVAVAWAGWKVGTWLDEQIRVDEILGTLLERFKALRDFFASVHGSEGRWLSTILGGGITGPLMEIAGQKAETMTGEEAFRRQQAATVEANRARRAAKSGVSGSDISARDTGARLSTGDFGFRPAATPARTGETRSSTSTVNRNTRNDFTFNVTTPQDTETLARAVANRLRQFSRAGWGL